MSKEKKQIEVEIEIDLDTGDIYFSRDHEFVLDIAKQINPDDIGVLQCFIEKKPKTIDGDKNYKSFCG